MTLTDRLRNAFGIQPRAVTPEQLWGGSWESLTSAGVEVTVETAMRAAMGACVRLLADDIASLPIDAYRRSGKDRLPIDPPGWLLSPTGRRWDTTVSHIGDAVVSLLTDGNLFVEASPHTYTPVYLSVLDPRKVDIKVGPRGGVSYAINGRVTLTDVEIMHVPWLRLPGSVRGLNMVDAAKESTGLELAAREWAGAFFKNGATLGGVILLPQGVARPSKEEIAQMREDFDKRHKGVSKSWLLGILTGGATIHQGSISPGDAALEPRWRHVLKEAARFYHIPPHLLASQDPGGSSYSSVEHRSIDTSSTPSCRWSPGWRPPTAASSRAMTPSSRSTWTPPPAG
jgi:HK97 family phage portal protein